MTTILQHPVQFKQGARVLILVSRNKDNSAKAPTVRRVSYNEEGFEIQLGSLLEKMKEGQRIYASAEPRDLEKARRAFRLAQLNSEYDEDPMEFYRRLESRWKTALMQKANVQKEERLWLLDTDTPEELHIANETMRIAEHRGLVHEYDSKAGRHILIRPFDLRGTPDSFKKMIHKNPLMLWAY